MAISLTEKDDILDFHNSIRQIHGKTTALKWSDTLSENSQSYVQSCRYNDRSNTLNLYKKDLIIDNVASGYPDWSSVIKAWYAGEKNYNYNVPGYTRESGSFITMVWKDTTTIGCSSFKCDNGETTLYQCLYSPSIPVSSLFDEEEYKSNVLPASP